MTPIADMVEQMLARGVAPDLIVMAVRAAELASGKSGGIPVDETAEKRRAYDRARKAEKRNSTGNSTGIPPDEELHIEKNKNPEKNERKKSTPAITLPPDWTPSTDGREYARAKGWNEQRITSEGERFRNHSHSHGRKHRDVEAAWRNWVTSPYQARPTTNTKPRGNSGFLELALEIGEHEHSDHPEPRVIESSR